MDPLQRGPETRKAMIMEHLTRHYQLKPDAVKAILATFKHESNFDPTNNTGDKGTAFGLAQWRLNRQSNLRQYAAAKGKPATDMLTQVDFMMHEMGIPKDGKLEKGFGAGSEAAAGKKLLEATTLSQAIMAMAGFERYRGFQSTGGETAERLATAREYSPTVMLAFARQNSPSMRA
jgi:hypothetical protein